MQPDNIILPNSISFKTNNVWMHVSGTIAAEGGWGEGTHEHTIAVTLPEKVKYDSDIVASATPNHLSVRDGTADFNVSVNRALSTQDGEKLWLKIAIAVAGQGPHYRSKIFSISFSAALLVK